MIADLCALAPVGWERLRHGRTRGVPTGVLALGAGLMFGSGLVPGFAWLAWGAARGGPLYGPFVWTAALLGGVLGSVVVGLGADLGPSARPAWPLLPVPAHTRRLGVALLAVGVALVVAALGWLPALLLPRVLGAEPPRLGLVAGSLGLVALAASAASAALLRLLGARGRPVALERWLLVAGGAGFVALALAKAGGPWLVALPLGGLVVAAAVPWPERRPRPASGPARLGARALPPWLAWWGVVFAGPRFAIRLTLAAAALRLLYADTVPTIGLSAAVAAQWGGGVAMSLGAAAQRAGGRSGRAPCMLPIRYEQALTQVVLLALGGGALCSLLGGGGPTLVGVATCATTSLGIVIAVDCIERTSALRVVGVALATLLQPMFVGPALLETLGLTRWEAPWACVHLLLSVGLLLLPAGAPSRPAARTAAGPTAPPLVGGAA